MAASNDPAGLDRGSGLRATFAALAIVAAGMAVAAACAQWLVAEAASDSAERLDRLAARVGRTIEPRFATPVYGLRGLRASMAAHGDMSRSQFRDWVSARDLPAEFPGVRAFAYAEQVYRWSTIRFVERTRRDGAPDFDIRTQGEAPDLYVVKYIEPFAEFAPVLGSDIGAEATRRTAIDAAIETGGPALTAPLDLMGMGGQPTPGFLLMLAVYDGGTVPGTVAARREKTRGILYVPFLVDDLIDAAAAAADGLVEFDLFDGLPDGSIRPFSSFRAPGSAVPVSAEAPAVRPTFFVPLVFANRLIVMRAWGSPQWNAGNDRTTPFAVGAGIWALSFCVALVVWLAMTGRARALALARRMTVELDRLAKVVERTTNGVVITGPDRRIVWVNDGFTRLTGYSAAEAVGRKPRELVGFEGTSTERDDELRRCLDERRPFRGEIRNLAKDGRT